MTTPTPRTGPVVVSGSSQANTTFGATVVVPAPAGIVAGNLLVALCYSAANSTTSWAGPSGWTAKAENVNSTAGTSAVFTHTASGSEPGAYTFTAAGNAWGCAAILQISGLADIAATAIAFNTDSTNPTACTAPSQTPAAIGDLLLAAFCSYSGRNFTTPAGMTAGPSAANAGVESIFTFYENVSSVAATGPIASTQSAGSAYTGISICRTPPGGSGLIGYVPMDSPNIEVRDLGSGTLYQTFSSGTGNQYTFAALSPDGAHIAFVNEKSIQFIEAGSYTLGPKCNLSISQNAICGAWSPDSTTFYVQTLGAPGPIIPVVWQGPGIAGVAGAAIASSYAGVYQNQIAVSADGSRLYCADGTSSGTTGQYLSAYILPSGASAWIVPMGGQVGSIVVSPDGLYVYCTVAATGKCYKINAGTGTIVNTGGLTLPATFPALALLTDSGSTLWVANYNGPSVSVIDTTGSMTKLGDLLTASAPWGLNPTPDGSKIWVGTQGRYIQPIDKAVLEVGAGFDLGTSFGSAIQVIPTAGGPPPSFPSAPAKAYVTNSSGTVTVVDPVTAASLGTVTVANTVQMAAVSPDGRTAAVLSINGPTVQFISTATDAVVGPAIAFGGNPPNVIEGLCWANDSSKVYVLGYTGTTGWIQSCTPSGSLGAQWSIGTVAYNSVGIVISPDGSKLYCNTGNVLEVDTTSGAVTRTFTVPAPGVSGYLVITPDGSTLYASNYKNAPNGLIYPITVASGTVGTPVPTGAYPYGLWTDGVSLWNAEIDNKVLVYSLPGLTVSHTISSGVPSAQDMAMLPDGSGCLVAITGGVAPINTTTFTAGTLTSIASTIRGIGVKQRTLVATAPPPPVTSSVALGPLNTQVGGTLPGGGTLPPPVISAPTISGTAVLNLGPLSIVAGDTILTRTGTVVMSLGPLRLAVIGSNTGPNAWPVPGHRGRWRLTLHNRQFAPATLFSTMIAELADARGRQLVQAWNTPATLTFTLDGHSQAAALIQELEQDVVAWRWDDQSGSDVPVFRGVIAQSEDQITTESHTVNYVCHDYATMLDRRLITATYTVTARDQDLIVGDLLSLASAAHTSSGAALSPASYLPLALLAVAANGSARGLSGQSRDRTYYGSQNIGQAFDDLAKVAGGFDFDVQPSATDATDSLRIFYPQQGINRTGFALQYGATVATVTRSVNSADYANYVRVLGNNTSAAPTPQFFSEALEAGTASSSAGLWMIADDATDVTIQSTLDEKAAGALALDEVLVPAYTLGLAPGAYEWGQPNMGDVCTLLIQTGRLDVNTSVRVLGITYDIGDDGQEDVVLVVGRPPPSFRKLLTQNDRDVRALARR
jgi:hypothetical protein